MSERLTRAIGALTALDEDRFDALALTVRNEVIDAWVDAEARADADECPCCGYIGETHAKDCPRILAQLAAEARADALDVLCAAIWNGCKCARRPHGNADDIFDHHVWRNTLDGDMVDPAKYPEARTDALDVDALTLHRATDDAGLPCNGDHSKGWGTCQLVAARLAERQP